MPPERMEISVIPQDLRQEETIVQIAEALDDLNFTVNHIFDSLNQRITENTKRLGDIRDRAAVVQGKLNHLSSNLNLKAVKLYSAAKYPASHIYKEYELAIKPKFRKEIKPYEIYKSPVPILEKSGTPLTMSSKVDNGQNASNANMQEKLQFYYVKSKPSKKKKPYEIERDEIRSNVSSVSALLLFNKKDSTTGNNNNIVDTSTNQKDDKKKQIEDAPDSILQPWHTSEIESSSTYLYAPTLGEVPQINVPLLLPDLPGIVDDERFVLDLNFQNPIAPSSAVVTPTTLRNEPPTLEQRDSSSIIKQPVDVVTATTVDHPLPIADPPALPKLETSIITPVIKKSTESIRSAVPPPPPPPLPPTSPPEPDEPKQEEKKQALKKPVSVKPSIPDDRSNLMAAIRDAGGIGKAKLRSAALVDNKTQERWSSASVGNDLMADLHNTLSLRRKGIAGLATNTLARLSSMIPPPPKPSESDHNSVTSESQDDDGWEE